MASVRYRADVDGLRAVAIVLVVGFHVGLRGFTGGFAGVDVFFVVSGFLITGLLLAELEEGGRIAFADFYARRIRRLLPALTLVIAATLALGATVLLPWQFRQLGTSSITAAVFGSNVYFWRAVGGYFGLVESDQPLLHTWSLGVEEQFYLIWPATLALAWWTARRRRWSQRRTLGAAMLALSALSFAAAVAGSERDPSGVFYLLPTRLWELGAGGLLALWRPQPGGRTALPASLAGAAAIVGTSVLEHGTTGWPGVRALPVVLGTAAIVAAGSNGSPVNRLLATGPCALLGRLSYSWYLWHFPLLVLVRLDTLRTDTLRDSGVAIGALGLAGLTYLFVEQPVRRRRLRFLRVQWATFVLGAVLISVGVLGGAVALSTPKSAIEQARSSDYGCLVDVVGAPVRLPSSCVPVQGRHGAIVLLGDSHAAALQPALEEVARRLGMRLEVSTRSSCAFAAGIGGDCSATYAADLRAVLSQTPPVRLVVLHDAPTTSRANFQAPVAAFARHRIRVLVVLPTPDPDVVLRDDDVTACLARRSGAACAFPRTAAERRRDPTVSAQRRAVAGQPLASIWDPLPFFCGRVLCRVEVRGAPLYRDGHHISIAAARLLVPRLLPAVRAALATG